MLRLPALIVLVLAALVARPARADEVDVVVQAGHQGRPASCAQFAVRACNLGAASGGARERDWTPVVADETARALRAAGLRVARRPADYAEHDRARAAVFLHFDGSATPCGSGASVGFPDSTDAAFVQAWERTYRAWFPFRFVGENFTDNEHRYYGFRKVDAPQKMLVEFGELSCPAQREWMQPRLRELGERLAEFLIGWLRP